MTSARYNSAVRIGNWLEDRQLNDAKKNDFKFNRDNGKLLSLKFQKLFTNLHKEISMVPAKNNVYFGSIVQLKPYSMILCNKGELNGDLALSIVITEKVVRYDQHVSDACELTIAPSPKPVVRNSFRIISADETDRTNESLKYGQRFLLECVDETESLLLFTTQKMHNLGSLKETAFGGEINLPLGLVWRKNCGSSKNISLGSCNWFCKHYNPKDRLRTDGLPVPCNEPIVITHLATNRNLAADNTMMQTLFGAEFLVSVQTYKDIYGRENWQNIWMIYNGHHFKKR